MRERGRSFASDASLGWLSPHARKPPTDNEAEGAGKKEARDALHAGIIAGDRRRVKIFVS